jgi:membrane protein DedA with SNARE-associated domain
VHDLLRTLADLYARYGYWTLAGALLLENAGVPVPGETALLLAAALAYRKHELEIGWIIVVAVVAATIGDNIGYAIGRYGGRPLVRRFGRWFFISPHTLEHGEQFVRRRGMVAIFVARFISGVRVVAGPIAGALQMDWPKFALANFLGAVFWVCIIAGIGYYFGRHLHRLEHVITHFGFALLALLILWIGFRWWRHRRTSKSVDSQQPAE